ncbi:MAG: hypothetical protein FJ308_10365, partial [Planctomycetes bacterium]|nr:hypothetical protein [Planctomycetota bacterium]
MASSGTNGYLGDSRTGGRLMVCDEEPQVGAGNTVLETPPTRELLDSHFSHSTTASNRKSRRTITGHNTISQRNPNMLPAAILATRLAATPWRACICFNISATLMLRLSDVQKAGNVVDSRP